MKEINQKYQIKFDFKFWKESRDFLDILVYIAINNKLQTTFYKNATDRENYLHAISAHTFLTLKMYCLLSGADNKTHMFNSQGIHRTFLGINKKIC